MSKENRLDELAERIVQTGNYLAGGERFTFDDVREQLDTSDGRESLIKVLNAEANSYHIAMFYEDDEYDNDKNGLIMADNLIKDIQSLDDDREME